MNTRVRTLTRNNIIFGVAIAVLLLVVLMRPDAVTSIDRDDLPAVFPDLDLERIRRIEISRGEGPDAEAIRLERAPAGNSWLLASHFQYPTQAGPARLLDAVVAARTRGVVTTRAETFARYAGDQGWTDVVLTDLEGKPALAFGIGKTSYPETFLRLGQGEESRIVKAINLATGVARTDVGAWIETRLWPELSSSNAVRIDVEQRADERTITLVKRGVPDAQTGLPVPPKPEPADGEGEDGAKGESKDEGWYMASPRPGEARTLAVEDLLRQFTGILIEDIVAGDASGGDAATYGLDKPELVVTLHHVVEGKPTQHVLVVGKQTPEGDGWYVQRKGARWVFRVAASSLARMRQMPSVFRAEEPAKDDAPKDDEPKDEAAKDEPAKDEPAKDK